jgi:hypothetical protein
MRCRLQQGLALLRHVAKRMGSPSIAALAADKGADLLSVTAVLFDSSPFAMVSLGDTFAASWSRA